MAQELPADLADAVLHAARVAFTDGLHLAAVAAMVAMVLGAVAALVTLRGAQPADPTAALPSDPKPTALPASAEA